MAGGIVDTILECEKQAKEVVAKSRACAAEIISNAEKAGAEYIERVKAEEEQKLVDYGKALDENAEKKINDGLIETKVKCDMLVNAAKSKAKAASDAVYERIVGKNVDL